MVHLIDASVYIFRAWFSVSDRVVDPEGRPVNAVLGFARFLTGLLKEARPAHIAVAFDESLTTSFRNELYAPYKANRELPPPELEYQFGLCRELAETLGLACFASARYEADDIIGTLAVRMRACGRSVAVVTRDKDLSQVLEENDMYWDYAGGRRITYAEAAGVFGARPEQMPDYLGLVGDSVDNIPGVPGIGAKTASTLLAAYDGLDEIYAGLDRIADLPLRGAARVRERLEAHREEAYLARTLATLAIDVPLSVTNEEALRRRRPDPARLAELTNRLGFGRRLQGAVAGLLREDP
jgi:5'-3' exonuclease